ncbi:uncharacterized protein [Ptychodera flava]|uniref:uncharacterized protein isoform X2 n=1 Tax=Ptychodera flava TaxID=63121 RepID=UPI003969FF25
MLTGNFLRGLPDGRNIKSEKWNCNTRFARPECPLVLCSRIFREEKRPSCQKIDPHHLLTRHRSALCKRDLGSARRKDFIEVAEGNNTKLKLGMLEESLNMQSTDLALITFSESVEHELVNKGYTASAELCNNVRMWFEAQDEPGISAINRCKMKVRYRNKLLGMVDLMSFPPPGMHIQGYPKSLWESTIASVDADLLLYGIAARRTYNQRAVSSQTCEGLYSSLATMPGSKNGVPNCVDLETNMAKLCGEMVVRYDPSRGFPLRMSSSTVYPQRQLEDDVGPLPSPKKSPQFITSITLKDHLLIAS